MNRYQILIEYVGTGFIGWQIQPKGKSIQKLIQLKISKLLKEKIKLVGSGRTDTGVHAMEQSAHFDTKSKIENLNKFLKSINFFLNSELVSIKKIKKKNLTFHERFYASCNAKSPIRTIKLIKIKKAKDKIEIKFISQSFLQQQVRSMVGCLKYLAEKKWNLKKFEKVFKSKRRNLCAPPAPSHGLFLEKVIY